MDFLEILQNFTLKNMRKLWKYVAKTSQSKMDWLFWFKVQLEWNAPHFIVSGPLSNLYSMFQTHFSPDLYLLQEIIITELGFAKHEVVQLQTSARRAQVM